MAYQFGLNLGQQLFVQQQGEQTAIALYAGSAGQQQQQQTTVMTGTWQEPPVLWQTAAGFVLKLVGAQGATRVQIQAEGLQILSAASQLNLADANPIAGQKVADSPVQAGFEMKPMKPMQPMEPLKMGNMSMQMNPMSMQMGDMKLEMGNPSTPENSGEQAETASETRRFCTQCGHGVSPGDRFCAHCGHQLLA
ncbi:MAG: zinc ribbon domain-containing protein [Cyanobacteria bacterium P01_A01_bin.123]